MRARSSFQVCATSLWSSFCSWIVTVRSAAWLPLRMSSSQAYKSSEPITPRFSVTSVALLRPVIVIVLFSLELPLRYSLTVTSVEIALTSWKPARGPAVLPSPRSTRKLNWQYGRSRKTAITASSKLRVERPRPDSRSRDDRALGRETALGGPAVQPFERIVEALGRPAAPQLVANEALDALGVIEPAHLARHEDDARRSGDARALVEREGGIDVVAARGERAAEGHRILERHARALREVLEERMGGVAEQRRAAVRPGRDRLAVGGRPAPPALRQVEQAARARADAVEVREHLLPAAFAHAPGLGIAAVEGDDDVVLVAAAQRIVDEVAVRSDPHRGRVPAQVGREVGGVDDGPVHDVAGDAHVVADGLRANRRLDAVATHQSGTAMN